MRNIVLIYQNQKLEQYRFHFDATACIDVTVVKVVTNEQNNNSADVK